MYRQKTTGSREPVAVTNNGANATVAATTAPVNVLLTCSSPQVFKVLKDIGFRNGIWLFGGNAWELAGGNQNVNYCLHLEYQRQALHQLLHHMD